MHEVRNHRAVPQVKKLSAVLRISPCQVIKLTLSQRAQRPITPTRSNGKKEGDLHWNLAPSTPMDPRSSNRMGKSFMSPTNASASRIAAIETIRTGDVFENAASDISPRQGRGPQGKKDKRTPVPDPAHLKGDVRTPNGIVSRTQAQKPLTRTQRLDEASLRKLQNARTIQFSAQNRNRAKVAQPKKSNKPQEQRNVRKNIPLARGRAQSPLDMVAQPHGPKDQTTAFRMSTYGKARGDDFHFPGAFLPEVPERTSSSPGRGVKSSWGLPSLSMFSSSPPKPDINVEAIVEHNKHLEGAIFHWRQENLKLNEDLKQLRQVNEQHESDLRELQTKSFKEISKSIWSPLEDQVVRETLETIHKEIEDWAEDNCVKTFNDVEDSCISNTEAGMMLNFLKDIASTDSDNLWSQFRVWRGQQIDPELVFTAVITSYMYDQVFRNPFTVLDAFEVQKSYEGQVSKQSEFVEDQYDHRSELSDDESASVQSEDQLGDEKCDEYLLKKFFEPDCEGTERDSDAGGSGPEYQEDEDMEDADSRAYEHDGQQPSSPKPSVVMLETYHTLKQCKHIDFKRIIHILTCHSKPRTIPTLALSAHENPLSYTQI
jgi:hypothetical protein